MAQLKARTAATAAPASDNDRGCGMLWVKGLGLGFEPRCKRVQGLGFRVRSFRLEVLGFKILGYRGQGWGISATPAPNGNVTMETD